MESPAPAPGTSPTPIEGSYLPSQIPDHTAAVWQDRKAIACAFRTQVDFLLSHHMLLRSSYRLPIELADCFCLDVPHQSPQQRGPAPKALVILMRQGKANQDGRMEYGAALRHRDPMACLVSALAFWFFWRWQVEDEGFPSFLRSCFWYDIKLLRQAKDSLTQQLSPQTANSWMRRLFEKCGIKAPKAPHTPSIALRSRNADPSAVVEASIRRPGTWDNGDEITDRYLGSLPREAMRETADFDFDSAGSYYIPRSTVDPPAALLSRVWPNLDQWKMLHDLGDIEPTKAVGAFIELLLWLRVVLLQDAPFLMAQYPSHPLFADGVFHSPEFLDFAAQVKDACRREKDDSHVVDIGNAIPSVAEQLRILSEQRVVSDRKMMRGFETLSYSLEAINQKLDHVARQIQSLQHLRVSFDIAPDGQQPPRLTVPPTPHGPSYETTTSGSNGQNMTGMLAAPLQPVATTPQPLRANSRPLHVNNQSLRANDQPLQANNQSLRAIDGPLHPNEQPPQYRLPRDTESIVELLELWRQGGVVMPSIDALEQRWGTRWRPASEKSFYSTRKTIIDEIVRRAVTTGQTERSVARQMDRERGSASLDKVMKNIRSQRRQHQASHSLVVSPLGGSPADSG